jgi:hydrogenase/urease accessory protein HupE
MKRSSGNVVLACLSLGITLAVPALAHQEPYSWLDLHVSASGVEGSMTAHMVDLSHEAGIAVPESLLDSRFLASHRAVLDRAMEPRLDVLADGSRVRPVWDDLSPEPSRRAVRFAWHAAWEHRPGVLEVRGPLFPYDPAHETYVHLYEGASLDRQELLDHSHTAFTAYAGSVQGVWAVVRRFVAQGIHHIAIGPDHILFIVGLLLLGGGVGRLLKIVTAFTAAHSITLALATLGLVQPPARLVEPAIALSIVVVGIDALLGAQASRHQRSASLRAVTRDRRALYAFCFGLVHGFGFAGVLRDLELPAGALGWSLASFNVGVEIGQVTIVLAVAPLLAWARDARPTWANRLVTAGALAIAVAGAFWFVQRTIAPAV